MGVITDWTTTDYRAESDHITHLYQFRFHSESDKYMKSSSCAQRSDWDCTAGLNRSVLAVICCNISCLMLRRSAITPVVQYLCCSWTSQQQTSRNLQTSLPLQLCRWHTIHYCGASGTAASCCHWKLLTSWTNAILRTGTKSSAALVCPSCCNSNGPCL